MSLLWLPSGPYGGTLRWSEEGQQLVFHYIDQLQNPSNCEDVLWLEAMPLDGTHGLGASIHNVIKGAAAALLLNRTLLTSPPGAEKGLFRYRGKCSEVIAAMTVAASIAV